MARWRASAASLLAALTVLTVSPGAASAHPIDELLQQVYVTPTAGRIQLAVEVLPGGAVATDFLPVVDSDGDGSMSPAEQAAFTSMLHSHIGLEIDGVIVDTEVKYAIYPDSDLMIAGGGAIAISLTAVTPGNGEHRITVSDSYVPTDGSGAQMKSTFQMNLTTETGLPLDIGQIERSNDGRSLTTTYELDDGDSPSRQVPFIPILIILTAVLSTIGGGFAIARRRSDFRRTDDDQRPSHASRPPSTLDPTLEFHGLSQTSRWLAVQRSATKLR